MDNIIDEVKKYIQSSDLSVEEKMEFSEITGKISEKELFSVAGLFSENLSWVRLLYDNYRFKKEALANNDIEAIEKILKEEEEMLQKIEE